jgi:glycosyltransferase involved in cell wall biosynthesis
VSKVLQVAEFRNPAGGGFVASIERLAQRHRELEMTFLCPSDAFPWVPSLRVAGVRVLAARTQFEVTTLIARERPDVVHAHFVSWAVPAMLGSTAVNAQMIWHLHSGLQHGQSRVTLGRRLKYAIAKRLVDTFFCVSPDLVAYLRGAGVPADRILEIPNGVDLDFFRPPLLDERAAARRRYGIRLEEKVLLFFGRDAFIKGADRLAAALPLSSSRPHVLVLAASPASLRALTAERTSDLGYVRDVREIFWAADALVLPSRAETVTYGLLEARACGLPAIAAPLPGIRQAFGADTGTALADCDDPRALACAIDTAVEREPVPLSAEMREAASLDRWADRVASCYRIGKAA